MARGCFWTHRACSGASTRNDLSVSSFSSNEPDYDVVVWSRSRGLQGLAWASTVVEETEETEETESIKAGEAAKRSQRNVHN